MALKIYIYHSGLECVHRGDRHIHQWEQKYESCLHSSLCVAYKTFHQEPVHDLAKMLGNVTNTMRHSYSSMAGLPRVGKQTQGEPLQTKNATDFSRKHLGSPQLCIKFLSEALNEAIENVVTDGEHWALKMTESWGYCLCWSLYTQKELFIWKKGREEGRRSTVWEIVYSVWRHIEKCRLLGVFKFQSLQL
jgi:hypothetical protein